jgi:anti-sigma regulatory factor (Ser/Thr protein kinase)
MRELMDDVEIEPSDHGTTVTMRRRLRGNEPA